MCPYDHHYNYISARVNYKHYDRHHLSTNIPLLPYFPDMFSTLHLQHRSNSRSTTPWGFLPSGDNVDFVTRGNVLYVAAYFSGEKRRILIANFSDTVSRDIQFLVLRFFYAWRSLPMQLN